MQQEETPNDTTQTAVLVLLFSALVTLVIFVIILYSSRRKLKRVIKVKTGIMKSKRFSSVLIMLIMIINFISNNLDTWVMYQFCIHVDIQMYIRKHKVSTKKKRIKILHVKCLVKKLHFHTMIRECLLWN